MGIENGLPDVNKNGWIGEDVSLTRNTFINPHQVVVARLVAHPGSFPHEIAEEDEGRFSPSLRSRYAQSGLHGANFASAIAVDAYLNAMDQDNFEFQFPLTNLIDAPIFLEKDTRLLRFYIPPAEFIGNGELIELVANQEIHIDGKEGVDWQFVYKKTQSGFLRTLLGLP